MKIVLIYGFLGSGKTTLINYMLKHVWISESVVILENESGKESVDGDFLRSQNYSVVDLRAGCVCCSLRSELPTVVKKIEEDIMPDVLVIEPSGIASLEDILSIPSFSSDSIISLVDVERYYLLMQLNRDFYIQQFRLSPTIFLTKTDLVDTTIVEQIKEELETISPMGRVIADYKDMEVSDWDDSLNINCNQFRSLVMQKDYKPINFINATFSITQSLEKDRIERFLEEMKILNLTPIRCKGIVNIGSQSVKLDFTGVSVIYTVVSGINIMGNSLTFWWIEEGLDINYKERVKELINYFLIKKTT